MYILRYRSVSFPSLIKRSQAETVLPLLVLGVFILISGCNTTPSEAPASVEAENVSIDFPEVTQSFVPQMEGPLRPIHVSPSGTLRTLDEKQVISITFSSPMTELGETVPLTSDMMVIDPPTQGSLRWEGTQTLVFEPSEPLRYATLYSIALSSELQSVQGETLSTPYAWTFETPRPYAYTITPQGDLANPEDAVVLYYHQEIDTTQLASFYSISQQSDGIEIPIRVTLTEKNEVVLDPTVTLQKGAYYTVYVRPGISSTEGALLSIENRTHSFRTYPEAQFESVTQLEDGILLTDSFDPARGVSLNFSTKVNFRDLNQSLSIDPPVDVHEAFTARYYLDASHRLPFLWKPQTTYTIRVDSLQDVHGQLITSAEHRFTTGAYRPNVRIPSGLLVVEANEGPYLPMYITNMDTVEMGMERLTMDNILPHINTYSSQYSRYRLDISNQAPTPANQHLALQVEPNIPEIQPLDMSPMLDDSLEVGIVGVHMLGPRLTEQQIAQKKSRRVYKSLVQVTRMGIAAKFSPYQNVFLVTDLTTATPVPEANITVRGPDNKVYWQGQTNADGIARTPGWYELNIPLGQYDYHPIQFVFAEKDGDITFTSSNANRGLEAYRFGISGDNQNSWYDDYNYHGEYYDYNTYGIPIKYKGLVFTDRGLYRDGETIHFKGMIRQKTDGEWEAYSDSVVVTLRSPDGEEVYKDRLLTSAMGTFDFEWTSPEGASLGSYYINVQKAGIHNVYLTSGYVRIDAFRRASFSVDVNTSAPQYIAGDFLESTLSGHYLFGAAMQNQPVRYSIRKSHRRYTPPGYSGYQFSSSRNYSYWYSQVIASGDSLLDSEGMYRLKTQLQPDDGGQATTVTVTATVTDPARQESSSSAEALVHPGLFYIGLKPQTRFLDLGESRAITMDVITVDPNGQPLAVSDIDVQLVREQWNSVREVGTDGRLRWRSERTEEIKVEESVQTETGKARRLTLPISEGGSYKFRAVATDLRGNQIRSETHFYATGEGYVAWRRTEDDHLTLVPERTTYTPGETARIMVQSPYEEATALITVEREGIMSSQVTTLQGSAPQIEIPLTEEHMPNAFVSVMLLTGRTAQPDGNSDPGAPAFKMGYVSLKVDPGTRHLAVEIIPDSETYRPGDDVTVDLRLVNANGRGVSGEIVFSAADAGVLNLINYTLPDPFDTFYGIRPLGVITNQTLANLVKQRNYGQKEQDEGGGGGTDGDRDIRSDFRPSAYWNPSIQTDERGRASITFKLPESLTTFRLMASALTADNTFGASHTDVIVTKPLILKPALPRFARLGDSFEAGVLLTNTTGNSGTATIEAEAQGIELAGLDIKETAIDDGATKEIRFNWNTLTAPDAYFTFAANLGRENDAFEFDIPIYLPATKITDATFASTAGQATEALRVPDGIVPDLGSFQAQVSSTALIGLEGAAEYLFLYPYGCLEQRTSRIRPLIAGEALLDMFDLDVLDGEKDELIRDWFVSLRKYWTRGGFALWPGNYYPNYFASAYVVLTIADARDAGYSIPQSLTNDALDALEQLVKSSTSKPEYLGDGAWNDTRALMIFALARHNRFLDQELYQFASRSLSPTNPIPISITGESYILRSLVLRNNTAYKSLMDGMVANLTQRLRVESTGAYLTASREPDARWIFASDVRATASGLAALIESNPPEEYRRFIDLMVRYLIQSRQAGRWASTQENAAVIDAFRLFQERYENEEPQFTAEVKLAGQSILKETFQGRSLNIKEGQVAVADLPPSQSLPIEIEKSGTGQLYYTVRLETYTTAPVDALSQGLTVTRTIERVNESGAVLGVVEPDGNGVRTLQAGDMVKVTLKLTSPAFRNYVVVDDPLPAGLETVNAAFATTDRNLTRGTGQSRWWGSFNHTEARDDRVLLFADFLERGEHTYTYIARATTPGTFTHPPAQSELMYQPEINGRTASGSLVVQTASGDMAVR